MTKEIKRTYFTASVVEYEVPPKAGKPAFTYKTLEVETEEMGTLRFFLDRNKDRNGIVLDILTK